MEEGILAGVIIVFLFLFVMIMAILVLQTIGHWKILQKAGEPGWGSLIPIYNQYLLCKITGVNPWWLLIVCLVSLFSVFIPFIGPLVSMATSVYFSILLNVSLAKSFGKDEGFAVGLILVAPIFYMILGLGDSQYIGPNPMNDIIFKNNDFTGNSFGNNNTKYCSNCGVKMNTNSNFCPNCGESTK